MPNIFKQLRKSAVTSYIFPKAEELEDDLPEEQEPGEPEREEDGPAEAENAGAEQESGAKKESEAEQTIGFAAVQAQKIVEDAEQRAQELVQERMREAEAEIENAREEAKARDTARAMRRVFPKRPWRQKLVWTLSCGSRLRKSQIFSKRLRWQGKR